MGTLAVWRFDTPEAAEVAAARIDVADAAVVTWPLGSPRPRARQVEAGPDSLDPGFWGLLFGIVFFVPLLGAAAGTPTNDPGGALADAGIDDHFVHQLRDQVTPGTSALVVLAADDVVDRVHTTLTDGARSQLLHSDLRPEQEAALRAVFGG